MPIRKLTADEKERFFKEDIPWRLAGLTSYTRYNDRIAHLLPEHKDAVLSALSLAHCAAGRLLLEFLGITYSRDHKLIEKDQYSEHDVNVTDLDGVFVRRKDLLPGEQEVLLEFLRLANRVAHVTEDFRMERGERNGDEAMAPAMKIIERLMEEHLYRPTGRRKIELSATTTN